MSPDEQKPLGERNYEQFAERYAEMVTTKPHNAYYEFPATMSLLPDVAGLHVLDAGCGPGHKTEWLLARGARVTAVDVTPDFVRITRERVGDRATVVRADLNQPLDCAEDGVFDVVLAALILDYFEDLAPLFAEFHRVLVPGGLLVASGGHPMSDWDYAKRALGEHSYFDAGYFEMPWKGFGEPYPLVGGYRHTLQGLLNPLIESGLRLEHVLEPLPTEQFRKTDSEGYEKLMHRPGFLCLRARKD